MANLGFVGKINVVPRIRSLWAWSGPPATTYAPKHPVQSQKVDGTPKPESCPLVPERGCRRDDPIQMCLLDPSLISLKYIINHLFRPSEAALLISCPEIEGAVDRCEAPYISYILTHYFLFALTLVIS